MDLYQNFGAKACCSTDRNPVRQSFLHRMKISSNIALIEPPPGLTMGGLVLVVITWIRVGRPDLEMTSLLHSKFRNLCRDQ